MPKKPPGKRSATSRARIKNIGISRPKTKKSITKKRKPRPQNV